MANNFPSGLNNYVTGTSSITLASAGHASAHNSYESKLGTGSSAQSPSNNTVLRGNGAGTSQWAQVVLTTDVSGTLPVGNGGTGATTLTGVLIGNGTSAFTTVTAPAGTIVGTTDTQTLTNKTLTSPIISTISNTGTLTLPTSTDTLVGRATTDTLTNKTLGTGTKMGLGSDAQGDVYYNSGSGTLARLAPGTAGQYLRTAGASANPAWTPPVIFGQNATTTGSTTSSTTAVDITNCSVSITTTQTANIFVTFTGNWTLSNTTRANWQILRGVTVIGPTIINDDSGSAGLNHSLAWSFLDQSVAAGTYTYKAQHFLNNGSYTLTTNFASITVLAFQ